MSKPSAGELNVSRETFERLDIYVSLIEKWTPKINLVSRGSLSSIWTRHIRDSLQVYFCGPDHFDHWLDLGSGGGLPGIVVAILAADSPQQKMVTLVESDGRKAAFLRTVLRETGVPGRIVCTRIETLEPQNADVISARALADLGQLMGYAERHLAPHGVAIFPKGVKWEDEVAAARLTWSFALETRSSQTEDGSLILKIGEVARV